MSPPRALLFVVLALGLTGCAVRRKAVVDPFVRALREADVVWASRAEAGSLEPAEKAYLALLAERPGEPEVLWRLARVAWSRALMEPAAAQSWHEVGREYALRCLADQPTLAEPLARVGDRLSTELVLQAEVPTQCLVYAAAHIVRFVEVRGPGAALDLEDALPLLEVAAGLAPGVDAPVREWAHGRAIVLSGGSAPDARAHLGAAVAAEPGLRFFRDDATAAFPDLAGTFGEWVPAPGWRLENGGE